MAKSNKKKDKTVKPPENENKNPQPIKLPEEEGGASTLDDGGSNPDPNKPRPPQP